MYEFDEWLAPGFRKILHRGLDYHMSEKTFVSALLQAAFIKNVRVRYIIFEGAVHVTVLNPDDKPAR